MQDLQLFFFLCSLFLYIVFVLWNITFFPGLLTKYGKKQKLDLEIPQMA